MEKKNNGKLYDWVMNVLFNVVLVFIALNLISVIILVGNGEIGMKSLINGVKISLFSLTISLILLMLHKDKSKYLFLTLLSLAAYGLVQMTVMQAFEPEGYFFEIILLALLFISVLLLIFELYTSKYEWKFVSYNDKGEEKWKLERHFRN